MTQDLLIEPAVEAGPIRLLGRAHPSAKGFFAGTQRVVPPAVTLERVRPHFARLGLTRLADITGLDRIGIPVVLSVRPNSRSLAVDAGKGFTLDAAMASAAMECVERHHGETAELPVFRAPYDRVAAEHAVVPFEHLMRVRGAHFTPGMPLDWTLGENLLAEGEVAVPAAMVRLDKIGWSERLPLPFASDSNGLSAGNDLPEALSYGLLECVERDAVTCWRLAWAKGRPPPRVRLETIDHEATRELLERLRLADIRVVLLDCEVDTGVPVYLAYLYDRVMRHVGLNNGYGAHLDRGIAMVRAITEAVQGRLVYIAGARDDFYRHVDLRCRLFDDAATIRAIEAMPETVDARARPSLDTPTFEGDLGLVLGRLRAVGIGQAVAFDLTQPAVGLPAVRVLVPGLEGHDSEFSVRGRRALAFAARQQGG